MSGNWIPLGIFSLTEEWRYSIEIECFIFLFKLKSIISPNRAYSVITNASIANNDFIFDNSQKVFFPESNTQIINLASPLLLLPEFESRVLALRTGKKYLSNWLVELEYFYPDPSSPLHLNNYYNSNYLNYSQSTLSSLLGIY